uniref:EKC/KEOPS complex subunit CGI121 n=1 Tax=Blastobotrys adeninivorans TaxID=409370 RepID=A0A060TEH1_BLAAD
MVVITFPQYPQIPVVITLFEDVKNAGFLREQLVSGNTDYNYAFINPRTILSEEHLRTALYRVLTDRAAGALRTKSLQSEVLFCLSANNNIMDALKRFGITDDLTCLYAIKIVEEGDPEDFVKFLQSSVDGTELEITKDNCSKFTDINVVKKNYKATDMTAIASAISLRGH